MSEGFFVYRKAVYFGNYDDGDVKGRRSAVAVKPESMKTDRAMEAGDWAVHFYSNHRLLEPEYDDTKIMLTKMAGIAQLSAGDVLDFSDVENRLSAAFPLELKLIYNAIADRPRFFEGDEHFLPLEEIYADSGVIVFYRKKRTPVAGYDIATGRLSRYSKKSWSADTEDVCVYQFCMGRLITTAMTCMNGVREGRCKGSFVKALSIEKELLPYCDEQFHLLCELNIYGIAVMYSEEGLIAWIRSNGLYADIHAGASNDALLDTLTEKLANISWK